MDDLAAALVVLAVFAGALMVCEAVVSLADWLATRRVRRWRRLEARRLVDRLEAVGAEVLIRGRER